MSVASKKLVAALSPTGTPRASLYLNVHAVDEFFSQEVGPIREIVRSEKIDAKFGASLLKILDVGVEGGKALSLGGNLSSVLQCILLEHKARTAGELVDLGDAPALPARMLTFVGPSVMVGTRVAIPEAPTGLPPDVAEAVERERMRQRADLEEMTGEKAGTVAWVARHPHAMASIGWSRWVDPGVWSSYRRMPVLGILGRLESEIAGATLIAPLWIWADR